MNHDYTKNIDCFDKEKQLFERCLTEDYKKQFEMQDVTSRERKRLLKRVQWNKKASFGQVVMNAVALSRLAKRDTMEAKKAEQRRCDDGHMCFGVAETLEHEESDTDEKGGYVPPSARNLISKTKSPQNRSSRPKRHS